MQRSVDTRTWSTGRLGLARRIHHHCCLVHLSRLQRHNTRSGRQKPAKIWTLLHSARVWLEHPSRVVLHLVGRICQPGVSESLHRGLVRDFRRALASTNRSEILPVAPLPVKDPQCPSAPRERNLPEREVQRPRGAGQAIHRWVGPKRHSCSGTTLGKTAAVGNGSCMVK
jgi:hypothetical protein